MGQKNPNKASDSLKLSIVLRGNKYRYKSRNLEAYKY